MEPSQLYAATRARLTDLVRDLSPDEIERTVPSTPAWTVRDVIAHLAGICDDALAQRTRDDGPNAQVAERAGRSLDEILAEWDDVGRRFEDALGSLPKPWPRMLTTDAITHEHDVRGAVGRQGAQDTPEFAFARNTFVFAFGNRIKQLGLPPVRVVAGQEEWVLGDAGGDAPAEPAVTLRTDEYELFRTLGGRRSRAQARKLGWEGDFEPYLDHLSPFGPPPDEDVID